MAFKLFSKDSTSLPQEKKQRFLIIILGVVLLVTFVILYFAYLRPSSPTPSGVAEPDTFLPAVEGEILAENIIKKIDFDIDFLKSPRFGALKIYGEWPLKIEEKGRTNPFLPY